MRNNIHIIFLALAGAFMAWCLAGNQQALADSTVTLDQPVHFTTAEGSDVVLDAGSYTVNAAEDWLRVTPSDGQAVDALLLEARSAGHEESLTAPLAISGQGEQPDTYHLALLLPGGKRLEAIGSYSGLRSRGTLSLFTIPQLKTFSSTTQSTTPTEYSTPLFGGSGGNRSYNLDCGNQSVLVGAIYKSGMWLDSLGIICQQVNSQTGALGNEFTRGPVGGSGGSGKISRCNQGDVVFSITPFSGQFVNGMVLHCKPWNTSQKQPSSSPVSLCANQRVCKFVGNYGPKNDQFACPAGKVGKAFRGKYGFYIDSMRFVCDLWDK